MALETSLVVIEAENVNNVITPALSPGFGDADAVLVWVGDFAANSSDIIVDSYQNAFGWAFPDGTHRCIGLYTPNNTLNGSSRQSDNRFIFVPGADGSNWQGAWRMNFVTDGVNVTGSRTGLANRLYPMYVLLMKGIVNKFDGTFFADETGGVPNSETVNCGFRPSLVISSTIGFEQPGNMDSPVDQGIFGVGFASEIAQKSVCTFVRNIDPRQISLGRADQLSCYYNFFTENAQWTVNCDNFTDTGFDLTTVAYGPNVNDYMFYLALDFGPNTTAEILDGVSSAGTEVDLQFESGTCIFGIVTDLLTVGPNVPQFTSAVGFNQWIAYPGREASIGFSDEDAVASQPNSKTLRADTQLKGLSWDGLDVWSGTSDFINSRPRMGFTRSTTSGAYFMAVSFGDAPAFVNKLWMGDIKPGMYFGDDQVDRVYMGDELVWVPD